MTASTDPSRRYVLDEDAPYLKNMAALWAVDPALAAEIERLAPSDNHRVSLSKSGQPTLCVHRDDGKEIHLHSRYSPIDEAARLIDAANVQQNVAFYLHGLGLGHHLQILFERASSEAMFCVLENDPNVIRAALTHVDLSHIIASKRVMFFARLDKSAMFARLTPHAAMFAMGATSIDHAPSIQLQPDFHEQMRVWTGEFASYCETTINTLVFNGKRTAENIARNVGWYAATPSLARLKDRHKQMPIVIVSAGPSLRKNKHLLKAAMGKAVIIAVQTTLKPLLEMGLEPDYVTSLDYHDISSRFYENLPPDLKCELVAEPKATNKVFELNPGPVTILGNDFAEQLIGEMKLDKARLPAGATVAHLAYYLAEYVGGDPIIFLGQDLGFSDGLCYTPGTSYEDVWRCELSRFCTLEMKQWEQIVRDRPILRRIPDHQGNPMYTEERLFTYLQQFERDFARSDRTIIDATEGGALKRGAAPMTFAAALERYCTRSLPPAPRDFPKMRWDRIDGCIDSLNRRIEDAREIERLADQTLPLLREVRDHLSDQGRVNQLIARIDALRVRMNEHSACYDLVMQLTQQTEIQRFKRDRHIAAARLDGMEKQRSQVNRDIDNVRGVIDAARQFCDLIRQVIQILHQTRRRMRAACQREAA